MRDTTLLAQQMEIAVHPEERETITLQFRDRLEEVGGERWEFLRVMEELAVLESGWKPENLNNLDMFLDPDCMESQQWKHRVLDHRVRRDTLLKAHEKEWRGVMKCELCDGDGLLVSHRGLELACSDCYGTGYACWPMVEEYEADTGTGCGSFRGFSIEATWSPYGWVDTITTTVENFLRPGVAGAIARYHPIDKVVLSDAIFMLTHSEPRDRIVTLFKANCPSQLFDHIEGRYDTQASFLRERSAVKAINEAALYYARSEAARLYPGVGS